MELWAVRGRRESSCPSDWPVVAGEHRTPAAAAPANAVRCEGPGGPGGIISIIGEPGMHRSCMGMGRPETGTMSPARWPGMAPAPLGGVPQAAGVRWRGVAGQDVPGTGVAPPWGVEQLRGVAVGVALPPGVPHTPPPESCCHSGCSGQVHSGCAPGSSAPPPPTPPPPPPPPPFLPPPPLLPGRPCACPCSRSRSC
jgi:hypothetical protein